MNNKLLNTSDFIGFISDAISNVQYDIDHCSSPSYLQDLNLILRTLEYIKDAANYGKRTYQENCL